MKQPTKTRQQKTTQICLTHKVLKNYTKIKDVINNNEGAIKQQK